jgi:hypothetical protein
LTSASGNFLMHRGASAMEVIHPKVNGQPISWPSCSLATFC